MATAGGRVNHYTSIAEYYLAQGYDILYNDSLYAIAIYTTLVMHNSITYVKYNTIHSVML